MDTGTHVVGRDRPVGGRLTGSAARRVIASLVLVAAALFAVGAIVEREGGEHAPAVRAGEHAIDHDETAPDAGAAEAFGLGEASEGRAEDHLLGVDVESTATLVAAVVVSVLLAVALVAVRRSAVLGFAAAFAVAFAVLDLAELARRVDRRAAGLSTVPAIVAITHLAAGALSLDALRRALRVAR